MPRVAPLAHDQLDPEIRHLCAQSEAQTGTSVSTRTYAHAPALLKALAAFRGELGRHGQLDPVLKEMVRLKIASLNACRY